MTITVHINDSAVTVPAGTTVEVLVNERFEDRRWLAVALDGEVVPRVRWTEQELHDGAAVEILTAVQGG